MKNKLKSILALSLFTVLGAFAQSGDVGIGTASPDVSAALDITSTSKGLLMPRMTTAERDLIATPAKGLTIFNITTNRLEFNSGTTLAPVWSSTTASSAWTTTGNEGTDGLNTNFIGTTDNQPLLIKVNNVLAMSFLTNGSYALGQGNIADTDITANGSYTKLTMRHRDNTTNATNISAIFGLSSGTSKNGSGTVGNLHDIRSTAQETTTSSGTIGSLTSIYAELQKRGSGNITDMFGVNVVQNQVAAGSGTITNYALYRGFTAVGEAVTGTLNVTNFNGSDITMRHDIINGTIGNSNGYRATFQFARGAATTSYAGFNSNFATGSAVNVSNIYGFYTSGINSISMTNAGSTIPNAYGMYIGNINRGSALNYSIYTLAGLTSFGDNVEQRGTGFLKIATGTTAQRPVTATAGMIRYNTTNTALEFNNGTTWNSVAVSNLYSADGTLSGNRTVSMGTNSLSFTGTGTTNFNAGNVGVGVATPVEKFEVNGAIKVGNTSTLTPTAGTIRFNSSNNKFEGYDGTAWQALN